MGAGVILIKSIVADYCNKSNRRQEKIIEGLTTLEKTP